MSDEIAQSQQLHFRFKWKKEMQNEYPHDQASGFDDVMNAHVKTFYDQFEFQKNEKIDQPVGVFLNHMSTQTIRVCKKNVSFDF